MALEVPNRRRAAIRQRRRESIHSPSSLSRVLGSCLLDYNILTYKQAQHSRIPQSGDSCALRFVTRFLVRRWLEKMAMLTWSSFGLAGGVIYILWETLQRIRATTREQKPRVSLSPLFHGLFAWPIMVPEAVEYALAELGILRAPPSTLNKESDELEAKPNDDSINDA